MMNKQKERMEKIKRWNFSRRYIEKFKYLLEKESSHLNNNLNDTHKLFFNKFVYYFESDFPIKNITRKRIKIVDG